MVACSVLPSRTTLTAIPRPPETDRGNLFVRLSPRTARRLALELLRFGDGRADDEICSTGDFSTDNCLRDNGGAADEFEVDFLPLEIAFEDSRSGEQIKIYASYNGGAPSSSIWRSALPSLRCDDDDIAELPLDLHPSLRTAFDKSEFFDVFIRPMLDVPVAERVVFEPTTTSDWELIEIDAAALEDGGVLNQVTVVSPGQILPLRLFSMDVAGVAFSTNCDSAAWVTVKEDGFISSSDDSDDSSSGWDNSDDETSTESSLAPSSVEIDRGDANGTRSDDRNVYRHSCVRLMAETEVAVIPKPRVRERGSDQDGRTKVKNKANDLSAPIRVQPNYSDFSNDVTGFLAAVRKNENDACGRPQSLSPSMESFLPPTPPPCCALLHPSTLKNVPGYHCLKQGNLNDSSLDVTDAPPTIMKLWKIENSRVYTKEKNNTPLGPYDDSRGFAVANIFISENVKEGHIAMDTMLRYQMGVAALGDYVCVQLLTAAEVASNMVCIQHAVFDGTLRAELKEVTTPTSFHYPLSTDKPQRYAGASTGRSSRAKYGTNTDILNGQNIETKAVTELITQQSTSNGPSLLSSGSLVLTTWLQMLKIPLPLVRAQPSTYLVRFFISPGHTNVHNGNRNSGKSDRTDPVNSHSPISPTFMSTNQLRSALLKDHDERINPDVTATRSGVGACDILDTTANESSKKHVISIPEGDQFLNVIPSIESLPIAIASPLSKVIQASKEIIVTRPERGLNANFFAPNEERKHAILLTGEKGSGKTHLAISIATCLRVHSLCATVYLDCNKLQCTPQIGLDSIIKELGRVFREALSKEPSVLILDDLDSIIPNVDSSDGEIGGSVLHHQSNPALINQVKLIVDQLLFLSRASAMSDRGYNSTKDGGIVLLCTCRDEDSLSFHFRNSGFFLSSAEVPSFDSTQRATFLHQLLFGRLVNPKKIPHDISRLGKMTDGFRPHDLRIIASRIRNLSTLRGLGRISASSNVSQKADHVTGQSIETPAVQETALISSLGHDAESIFQNYTPLSQQSMNVTHKQCALEWSSVGGLTRAKKVLYDNIVHPMKFKRIYDSVPTSLPRGVLLFGPPGCGKTFIAPALAKESNLNLIICRGPELLDRYIGASEAKVRQLFARAQAAAPAMIFFDEFDALAPKRGSDNTGVTDRVVNQLLTLLDGAESGNKANQLYIVASTSRPDKIDNALLRPGRLEKHVYIGYPQNEQEWNSLFESILNTRKLDEEMQKCLSDGDLFSTLCHDLPHARGFSAADMTAVLDTAHLSYVHEILEMNEGIVGNEVKASALSAQIEEEQTQTGEVVIAKRHVLDALRQSRPSLLIRDKLMLRKFYTEFLREKNSDSLRSFGDDDANLSEKEQNDTSESPSRSPGSFERHGLKTTLR